MIEAWTDYPIAPLGDESGKEAPIRRVRVLGWDGNKYAAIRCEGVLMSVKRGYLYCEAGRFIEGGDWRRESDGKLFDVPPVVQDIPWMPEWVQRHLEPKGTMEQLKEMMDDGYVLLRGGGRWVTAELGDPEKSGNEIYRGKSLEEAIASAHEGFRKQKIRNETTGRTVEP